MQFFSGRFKEKASDLILDFHSSISFDKRLYKYDIIGSIAHVKGLAKQNIISKEDAKLIEKNLREILKEIEEGKTIFSTEYEDIHMNIEKILIDRVGDIGKKLHTGRSRNDQIATDMKLFVKEEIVKVQILVLELMEILNKISKENISTYMPGFTHMQKAQPITFAHYLLAYIEMFKRDFIRLKNSFELLDFSPLGSAALAGTTYSLDRNYTSSILGFKGPTLNSIDSVSDRDYLIETLNDFAIIMIHLSRFCEEIIIFTSNDFNYIELSDSFSTGSSIMPQKKNPDAAELIRGKTGRVFGDLMALLTVMKGIPLAYNKDMQEDKENFFDALDTVKGCLKVFSGMISEIKVNKEIMKEAATKGFINATDVADYLVKKGISFRDAYKITGSMVVYCIEKNISFETLSLKEYKAFSKFFDKDVYEIISLEKCVERRESFGGPGRKGVKEHIDQMSNFIESSKEKLFKFKLNDILE